MTDSNKKLSLNEAASRFLVNLPSAEVGVSQQAIYQFVRWFGRERSLAELAADEIANYAQRISSSDTDYQRRLDLIKTFLMHAMKEGWTNKNLAIHLRTKKGKPRSTASIKQNAAAVIPLTQQGYDEIKSGLAALKSKRPEVIDEVKRAAEDKDFRENAPLHAARERLGHIDGRIIELEETLKLATVINEKVEIIEKVGTGDSIVLIDLSSGEELKYTIVSTKEVDPTRGKISSASPMGRAIIGRGRGDIIEIEVPAGRLRYRVEKVEH